MVGVFFLKKENTKAVHNPFIQNYNLIGKVALAI